MEKQDTSRYSEKLAYMLSLHNKNCTKKRKHFSEFAAWEHPRSIEQAANKLQNEASHREHPWDMSLD